ncbi:NADH-quinone oxidoreductase subunit NuoE [Halomonas sp. KAO]|uniref:NADH-quinone oxidoreductase subunit NuoE n=1 Tax=unclassified Halomonas TaxID=2609666 RepID=UPI0018A0A947|nr:MULTISPECIES: NADH-quinone oxidoreductase subunit NuoE [unclassified Halomonas]MBF7053568.1 NADH-quinone oxidoreductase subunit NuoE [Halomonas sp. KAO]MDT0500847.1 NADH-quinone oxidoreductase subunit NuoE [Halomonas sp. PAR7]MDT0512583.1 NADH-quinone oxidoreductase subunit NuoE [Halomonas sp. LES1]MDT0592835.1 NADH-quinone oxidoreductase subunit NuoE [Halomonas sp. PAR8]
MSQIPSSSAADTVDTVDTIATDGFQLHEEDRRAILEERGRYEQPRAACIEALKIVQRRHGWVPDGAIVAIAETLGVGAGEVEGVATFYSLIFRQPVGRHVILVCDSSACFLTGFEALSAALSRRLGIHFGQTTADGRFTLLPVCCLGACDRGPAMVIDEDTFGPIAADVLEELLEAYP